MIPVIIVTGFLGSGKTSLLARQLDKNETDSLSVIVHDLGEENIDIAYLQGGEHVNLASKGRLRSVSSGHLSSTHEKQLITEITAQAETEPRPSAILVESSGAADVTALTKHLQESKDKWEIVSVVTVIDTSLLPYYLKDPIIAPLIERQTSIASLLILNKWDRASIKEKRAAKKYIRALTNKTGASVIRSVFGDISTKELLKHRPIPCEMNLANSNAGASIDSVHLKARRPFHPERLEAWLRCSWPGIVRVKGFIWLASDMDGIYVIDAAGPQREIGLEGTWYASTNDETIKNDTEVQKLIAGYPWGDRRQALTVIGSSSGVSAAAKALESALLSDKEMSEGPAAWKVYPDPLTPQFS
ncbi:MAG: GTP-binding protein [Spirochaetales bacterium]|nr:GTP-binding protein [Spirochaetales bacterium]